MKKYFVFFLISVLLIVYIQAEDNRGLVVSIKELGFKQNVIGKQYVVIIAIDKYEKWFPLKNPVKDARELKNILTSLYYIDEVAELYDKDATKANIIKLFDKLRSKLKVEDSLLVIFAGHGYLDEITDTGFWIPVNGGTDVYAQENWLPNAQIRGLISKLKASHICLIADACFSGDILNSTRGITPTIDNEYFKKAYERTSRQVLTSGASETVPDRSEFCRLLKMALEKNKNPYLDPVMLYNEIRLGVKDTLPMIGNLKETGHQDGASFILFLRAAKEEVAAKEETKTETDKKAAKETVKVEERKTETTPKEDKAVTAAKTSEEKPAQEKTLTVLAQQGWKDTGIAIAKGYHVIVKYISGKWTTNSAYRLTEAGGLAERKVGDFPESSLIGRIGDNQPFLVGNYYEIKEADKAGKLYVRINDNDIYLGDNIGSIKIQIIISGEIKSTDKTDNTVPAAKTSGEMQTLENLFTFLTEYEGHKYYLSKQPATWHEAKAICEKYGAHLVTITSAEENEAIIKVIKTNGIKEDIFIGYTDEEQEGNWKWITGEKSSFKNWDAKQPDNRGDQDYANIWISPSNYRTWKYCWDDVQMKTIKIFILEME